MLAVAWVVAFVLVVAGRPRLAVVPAVLASVWGVILFLANFGGTFKDALPSDILLALQMTLIGVVPTLALVVAATRRSRPSGRRSVLTAVFLVLNTGIEITPNGGSGMSHPTSASVVSFLLWVCRAALLAMLLASMFDPRFGVAVIVVSVPVVVYRVGLLVAVESKPTGPVVLAIWAFATTAAVAVSSAISLRRPQLA